MDQQAWIRRWEAENGVATWAAYAEAGPDDPPGRVRPFRRHCRMNDADWLAAQRANAVRWMVWSERLERDLILANERLLWRGCANAACRRHRRCDGWKRIAVDAVPACCAEGSSFAAVTQARRRRDRATLAFIESRGVPRAVPAGEPWTGHD